MNDQAVQKLNEFDRRLKELDEVTAEGFNNALEGFKMYADQIALLTTRIENLERKLQ